MVTADPIEPGSAATLEAKAYLRVETDQEDALFAGLMRSAAALCEEFTGQTLIARGFVETMPASAAWQRLGRTPVRAVTGVETLAADGAATALPISGYAIDIDANGDGWARLTEPGSERRARVTYEAGMASDWAGLPEPLRQGSVRLAAHLYTHREREDGGGPPAAVTALWRPYRRMRLG
jgi:uncharacterized phiE125 gp8 family phage protein